MKYEIRKWCEGETNGLKLHVTDERGRTVFTSADYDKCVAERDRLNGGGVEHQVPDLGNRQAVRQKDGTVKISITPREIMPLT